MRSLLMIAVSLTLLFPSFGNSQAVTPEQRLQAMQERMKRLQNTIDTDHDNTLSASEIANAPAALRRLDRNGDGQLSPSESHGGAFAAFERIRLNLVFNFIDDDGDITVSADEIKAAPEKLRQLDENNDWKLTADELAPAPGPAPAFFGSPPQFNNAALWSSKMRDRNYQASNGPLLPGKDKRAYPGYLFYFGSYTTDRIQVQQNAFLRNPDGQVVHEWHNRLQTPDGSTAYLLANGLLLRTASRYNWKQLKNFPVGSNGVIELVDWESNLVWSYDYCKIGAYCLHHDLAPLPNGNILAIVFDQMSYAEAELLGWSQVETASGSVFSERIVELQPDLESGNTKIVWQWDSRDHLIQDQNPQRANFGDVSADPGKVDINFIGLNGPPFVTGQLFHFNSIDYSAALDQILVSSAINGEVWVIDHATTTTEAQGEKGDLLYRFGNPAVHRAGSAEQQILYWQHDAHWIGDKAEIQVFNNGSKRTVDGRPDAGQLFLGLLDGAYSDILRLALPMRSRRDYDLTRAPEITWHYNDDGGAGFYSPFMSSARKLPNGNVLMVQSYNNRIVEVTPAGETVEDYQLPERGHLYRVYKIPPTHPALQGRF